MFWPLLLVLGALAAAWLRWRFLNRRLVRMAEQFPGPRTVPLLGNALMFMCQPDELITVIKNLITEYGGALRFWLGPDLNVVVTNPEDLKVLLTSSKTSTKGPQYKYMQDVIGGGILSGSGRYFGTKLIKTICIRVLKRFRLSSTKTYENLKLSIAISASSLNGFHAILNPRD